MAQLCTDRAAARDKTDPIVGWRRRRRKWRTRRSDDKHDVLTQTFASTFLKKKEMTHFIFSFDQDLRSMMNDVFKYQQAKI